MEVFRPGGADAVDADAQTDHVVLVLREPFDAGRVEDVADGLVGERVHDPGAQFLVEGNLAQREGVVLGLIGRGQVGI